MGSHKEKTICSLSIELLLEQEVYTQKRIVFVQIKIVLKQTNKSV